jgi:hypothetical protein
MKVDHYARKHCWRRGSQPVVGSGSEISSSDGSDGSSASSSTSLKILIDCIFLLAASSHYQRLSFFFPLLTFEMNLK